jgi:hypothetical protein
MAYMNWAACAECGALNPPRANFCMQCAAPLPGGTPVPASPPAMTAALPAAPRLPRPFDTLWGFLSRPQSGLRSALRTTVLSLVIFVFAFGGYYLSTRLHTYSGPSVRWGEPARCCQWYGYLADAFNHGTFDLAEVGVAPNFHNDLITIDDKVYLPYQPMPGVVLMPFVAVWGVGLTEVNVSILLGALNVVLFFHVLRLIGVSRETKLLMIPFFAFGTQNFYSATTGSLWFYNHTTALFFLLLAVVFLLRRYNVALPALALGAAALSRQPTALAIPAFLYYMVEQRKPGVLSRIDLPGIAANFVRGHISKLWRLLKQAFAALRDVATDIRVLLAFALFLTVLAPFAGISLWYNEARFGGMFDTGLDDVYDKYEGVGYTLFLSTWGQEERFSEFDLRNILLHVYTIFLLPPTFEPDGTLFRPSEFGMSVLLTSSPLVFVALVKRSTPIKVFCWLALLLVPLPTLTYYSQGWVQFGYRYLMDYLPFLMILSAFGFDDNRSPTSFRIKVVLIVISIVIGFWGRWWGARLGW